VEVVVEVGRHGWWTPRLPAAPEALPVAELDELALLYGPSEGLLLRPVRQMVLLHRDHRRVHDLVLLFLRWRRYLVRDLLLRVGYRNIVVLGVAEEAQLVPWAGLVGGPISLLRVHVEGGVLAQIWQKDGPPAPDLVTSCPPMARHQRDRHPPGVDVPATIEMDVAQAHQRVLVIEGPCDLHRYVGLVPLLLGRWRLHLGFGR
jgi:hypothetical protein